MTTEPKLSRALDEIAGWSAPARLPADLWRAGRRRRRRRLAVAASAVTVLAVLLTAPLLAAPLLGGAGPAAPARPAAADARVPARVAAPLPLLRTAQDAPPGPAALLVSGDGAFRGSDLWGLEGRAAVLGRDGAQRLVRTFGESMAGDDLLLSPDGRYVAGSSGWLEGTGHTGDPHYAPAVLDLATGRVRVHGGGSAVAWAPDGRLLVADGAALALLDVGSGERYALPTRVADTWRGPAAFSPDGRRLAVQDGAALTVVDVAQRSQRTLADLGPRRRLAGPGAWTPDARRVAVFDLDGCLDDCTGTALDERTHRVAYLDPDTGAATPGPALQPLRGFTARLLGWQRDGDAVVGLHHARPGAEPLSQYPGGHERDFWAYGRVELLALHPGAGRTALVDLPAEASHVEVALDLLTADRFGGAPAPLRQRLLDLDWPLLGLLVAAAVGLPLAVRHIRRTRARRTAAHPGPAGPTIR